MKKLKVEFGSLFTDNTVYRVGDKEYTSLEDVPEEFRRFLDSDGDGKLDVFENRKPSGFFDSIETDEFDESNVRVKYLGSNQDTVEPDVKGSMNLVNSKKTDVSLNPVRDGAIQRMPNNFEMNIWKLVWIACFAAGVGYFLATSGLI